MKVKICGITNKVDALACEANGADALGFIFYAGSKRYVAPETAAGISRMLSVFTNAVGVFVNTPVQEVNRIMKTARMKTAQVIADDFTEYVRDCDYQLLPCYRIPDTFDFATIKINGIRSVLLDTFTNNAFGGTGKQFNWELIPDRLLPYTILAGGIKERDLPQIVRVIHPMGIDVSSALETEPGRKNHELVERFFKTLKEVR